MSQSKFSHEGYELIVTFDESNCRGYCEKLHYSDRYDDIGSLITSFMDFVDRIEKNKRKAALEKILQYQQEVWEKQDRLEDYLRGLGYSFYTYTIPGNQGNYRCAVNPEYEEVFQKNKNAEFPKWAVVRIF